MPTELYFIHLPQQLSDPSTFETLLSHLDVNSQARIKRFRQPADALRCLAGRLAPIWYLCKQNLLPSDSKPAFGTTAKGKPYLTSPELDRPLRYNISHEGDYVLLGATRSSSNIGVDIMRCPDDPREIQEGISDQLTKSEKGVLALNLSREERRKVISTLWTVKEGYVKAIGEGIGFGLDRIDVEIERDGAVNVVNADGRDISIDGWNWRTGNIGQRDTWAAFSKEEILNPEHIAWSDFISVFT